MELKLPESEVQGTPLTPEELKSIIAKENLTKTCRCNYVIDMKDASGQDSAYAGTFSASTATDCVVACASSCGGHSLNGNPIACKSFDWSFITEEHGSWSRDKN